MSAEVLREAARLMRERAEAATPGPWTAEAIGSEGYDIRADNPDGSIRRIRVGRFGNEKWEVDRSNAEHIASWHPAVALAVADLLDDGADFLDHVAAEYPDAVGDEGEFYLAVANAYLSDSPSPAVETPMPAAGEVTTP